jgi:hypothetical protein
MSATTDQEIFDQAIGEQTQNVPETSTEAPTEAEVERVRDEKGRFKSATPEPTSEEEVQEPAQLPVASVFDAPSPVEKDDARVPSWRLKEESDRRREAESGLAELRAEMRQMQMAMMQQRQPPPEAQAPEVDIFADPQGFVQQLQGNFDQRLRTLQLENSLRFAHYAHGDKFNEAYQAFSEHVGQTRDQATYQRVMAAPDPGEALVKWFNDQQLHKQLGGTDLNSFLEKQREEWLKDPAVQARVIEAFKATQQATQPNSLTNIPPSLSKATAASSPHDYGSSQNDIYAYATAKR